MEELKKAIRDIPDFPKKGIIFKDITTLLKDKNHFRKALDILAERYKKQPVDYIVGIESRGFIFAAALAYILKAGFIPIRKKGKLPGTTIDVTYELEYGTDTLSMHCDAIEPGSKILLIDDLLATGGTTKAAAQLITKAGGTIIGIAFLIELSFLNGRKGLEGYDLYSIISF